MDLTEKQIEELFEWGTTHMAISRKDKPVTINGVEVRGMFYAENKTKISWSPINMDEVRSLVWSKEKFEEYKLDEEIDELVADFLGDLERSLSIGRGGRIDLDHELVEQSLAKLIKFYLKK